IFDQGSRIPLEGIKSRQQALEGRARCLDAVGECPEFLLDQNHHLIFRPVRRILKISLHAQGELIRKPDDLLCITFEACVGSLIEVFGELCQHGRRNRVDFFPRRVRGGGRYERRRGADRSGYGSWRHWLERRRSENVGAGSWTLGAASGLDGTCGWGWRRGCTGRWRGGLGSSVQFLS